MIAVASNSNLMFISPHVIRMKFLVAPPGKKKHLDIDLSKFYLPATETKPCITPFASRPEYVSVIHAAICAYIDRNGYGHKTPKTIRAMVSTLVKFLEYLWLKGCFRLADCTPEHMELLLIPLAEGGWFKALDIEGRARNHLRDMPKEEIRKYLGESKKALDQSSRHLMLAGRLLHELGTNISGLERSGLRRVVFEMSGLPSESDQTIRSLVVPTSTVGMTREGLTRELTHLNWLALGVSVPMLPFVPFNSPHKTANKLGRPKGRTGSLKPQDVGILLKRSFWALDVLGPTLADVLDEYLKRLKKIADSGQLVPHQSRSALQNAIEQSDLEAIVGVSVTPTNRLSEGDTAFGRQIRSVMSAAFLVIAVLNGRRRGEVESPVYGLCEGAMKVVDERLGIYECRFYVEKTIRDYVWFYVGDATARAVRLLERLSVTARAILQVLQPNSSHHGELARLRSLFQIPTIYTRGAGDSPRWFSFGMRGSDTVLNDAMGSERRVTAHMFRRAYALIFFYRYEDGDLLALKQQLGHFDVEMTRAYVTWAAQKSLGATMADYGRLSATQRLGLAGDARAILSELDAVGKERIREFIEDVLKGGSNVTGGFVKLIQRFHQRWSGRIEYRLKTQMDQIAALTTFVIDRGHSVTPFPHGNCVASEKRNSAAGCYSHEQKGLHRENAGPQVCSQCPYHVLGIAHLSSLREDARAREGAMNSVASETVMGQRSRMELDNLKRLIALYDARLTQFAP